MNFDPSNLFIGSDHHFGHDRIRQYCNRPFSSVDEMDEVLISNWNAKIPPKGIVIHVGDIFLCSIERAKAIRKRLNGQICLVRGNHDRTALEMPEAFHWIKDVFHLKVPDSNAPRGLQEIVVNHYAQLVWNKMHYGVVHVFGHSHSNLNGWISEHLPEAKMMDVGVDNWNYSPLSYREVMDYMNQKKGQLLDHHQGDLK
jgi:calcineurin-like phosphoesterase family protein